MHQYIIKKNFTYGSLGIGYFVTKNAFVEFNYEILLNKDKIYGYNNSAYNYNNQTNEQLKLVSSLKLDYGWKFSL